MNVNFKQVMDKQDVEFYQLALLILLKKAGGSMSFNRADLTEAYKLMGEVNEIGDKVIIKAVPRVNLDEVKAKEYFDEARRYAQGVSEVSR
jgi:hypothetical protein